MSRKDFEAIAKVIRGADLGVDMNGESQRLRRELAEDMANVLGGSNPRFDRDRFVAACLWG